MSIALTDTSVVTNTTLNFQPRPHNLLSVAVEVTDAKPQWIYSGLDLETICGGVGTSTAFCLGGGETVPDKEPFTSDWPHLSPIAVYALHECSSIGKEWATREDDAKAALTLGESTALETAFLTMATDDTDTGQATAASLAEALFAAEDAAGYESGRVIHLTPGNALRLSEYLTVIDGTLSTKIGTPVVVGLGYVGDLDTAVLVTGTVLTASGETVVTDTVLDRPTNLVSVLAEKPYALGYACGATLITVTP